MRNRFENAVYIQQGACNPIAIANTFVEGCREARDQGADVRTCPALRLIAHQLAFLMRVADLDEGLTAYGEAIAACEVRAVSHHWHAHNPWAERLVSVPLESLAQCVAGGSINNMGTVEPYTVEFILKHWRKEHGEKLDAYILPQPDGLHSIGVRFGAEGNEYLSPHNANPEITNALLIQYGKN